VRRPEDLIYAIDERPPGPPLILARLDFEIDSELETGLITGHAEVPGLIGAFRQTGTAAVIYREIQLNLAISRSRRTFLHRQRQPLGEFLRGRLAADLLRIRCDVRTSALILSIRCGGTWLGRSSAEAMSLISGPHERKTAGCRRRSLTCRYQPLRGTP